MIPKVIHYCWFSEEVMPRKLRECFKSWKENLPGYTIQKWDLNNVTIDIPFAEKALEEKKWAFLTDYFRLKVLYEEGGIYLDTDVYVLKSLDPLLQYPSFWGTANNGMVEPVVIGAQPKNELIKSCMDIYKTMNVIDADFVYTEIPKLILPLFEAKGFQLTSEKTQQLNDGIIFPYDYFCPMPFEEAANHNFLSFTTNNTYAIHLWNTAWLKDPFRFFWNNRWKNGWHLALKQIITNPIQPLSFYKSLFYHLKRQLNIK